MEANKLRYIVMVLDTKSKEHDGKVFASYDEAREFANDYLVDKFCDKIVIGMFYLSDFKEILITNIETFGFTGDNKNFNQSKLF
jgi:hypothetical protein